MRRLLLFLSMLVTVYTVAQDGGLDTSFGNNGTVQTDIGGGTDFAFSIAQQTDGKLLVAGMFTIQSQAFPSIARYNPNGTLDNSFGNGAVAVFNRTGYEDKYYDIVLSQNDGKIVAGSKLHINSNNQYVAHRFLSDGSIDVNFGNNGEIILFPANIYAGDMVLLGDDSLLAVGEIIDNGISKVALKKYMSNGTLDTTFGNNGVVFTAAGNESSSALKVALGQNGKIVVLADRQDDGISSQILLRYLPDGGPDNTFGNNGLTVIANNPDFSSRYIALYSDGKIAVSSSFFDYQSNLNSNLISRYLPNGNLDTSFGNNGYVNPNRNNLTISKIEVQQNQRLLVFGELSDFMEGGGPFFIMRYYLDGYMESGFSFPVTSSQYFVSDMLTQQDGKIVCLAHTPWYDGPEDIIMERHVNNPLSNPEFEIQKAIIYPNPSNGVFTVERDLYSEKEAYQITDVTGKIILTGELEAEKTQIDLTSLQSGVYFLKTLNGVLRLMKN